MSKVVPGEGPTGARLAIIGEAPGETEEREGRPFCGRSGDRLNSWLTDASIARADCYVDNVMQVRPPRNNFKRFYDGKEPTPQLVQGRERLRQTMKKMRPNLILCLGNEALETLSGKRGIGRWRGSILPTPYGKVMATYHPAACMRFNSPSHWTPLAQMDVKKAAKESKHASYIAPFEWDNLIVTRSLPHALMYIEWALKHAKRLAIDLETIKYTRVITHFGFSDRRDHAVSIELCDDNGQSYYTLEEEVQLWDAISRLCASDIPKVFQNSVFDIPQLNYHSVEVANLWMDTMIAQSCNYLELPKDLNTLRSIYTDIPYYDDLKRSGKEVEFGLYNCLDCLTTWRIPDGMVKHAQALETETHYRTVVHPCIMPAIRMQNRGIRCDHEFREKEIEFLRKRERELLEELAGHTGPGFNPNSPKQVIAYLYDDLGLKPKKSRSTGKPTSDEEALLQLMKENPKLEELPLIIMCRHITKLVGTYLEAKMEEDGRLHTSWNVAGTITGRWSSSQCAWREGLNFQNVPYYERQMFVPDEGKVMIYADFAQAESRIVAMLAKEEGQLKVFREGGDIHRVNASAALGKPEEEITKNERYAVKQVGHAANYDAKARTISITMDKKLRGKKIKDAVRDPSALERQGIVYNTKEAQRVRNAYFARWMRIKMWQREVSDRLRKTRRIRNRFGRLRIFFGKWNDRLVREGLDFEPQSTVADLIDISIANLEAALPKGAELLLQNHDAVLLQCNEEDTECCCEIVNRAMTHDFGEVVVPAEVQVGHNWYELDDVEV